MKQQHLQGMFPYLISLGLALLVAGKSLLPGYILLLDLSWAPSFPVSWTQDGFNNSYPVYALIHFLTLIIPSWIVQKIFLIGMLFLLFFIPWRYMPYIRNIYGRLFAAGVFALNPFVYARILSGQWFHVVAYALLPFLLYALIQLTNIPTRRSTARVVIALLLVGIFSIHFVYLACILSAIWIVKHLFYSWWGSRKVHNQTHAKRLLKSSLIVAETFILISSYWIVPAMLRQTPVEERFNVVHYMAFASAPNKDIPVLENVAALGGFWGENVAWRYFFVFPQDSPYFWAAFIIIFLFILLGMRTMLKNRATRYSALVLISTGSLLYIASLGAAPTIFRNFNLFLYAHVPFWDGLRDSNKIIGIVALFYAIFAGLGVEKLITKIESILPRSLNEYGKMRPNEDNLGSVALSLLSIFVIFVPIVYGMYMWGGLHNQLQAVYYPYEWRALKNELDKMPPGQKVLVLPWHAYISMPFVGNRLIANPLTNYFGEDRVIVGKDVGVGQVHDQEVDPKYKSLDQVVTHAYLLKPNDLVDTLKGYGINGIIIIRNPLIRNSDDGLTKWNQYGDEEGATIVEDVANTVSTSSITWKQMLPTKTTKKAFGQSLFLLTL